MISFTSIQLESWLVAFMFPLARILALVASSPILGNKQVPVRIKVGFSVFITLVIAPTLGDMPQVEAGSAQGLLILIQQIIIGLAMGFTMRLIFTAVEMAGEFSGLQMGLGFASFYDPLNASFTPVIAQWMSIIASLAFLAMNGHLFMVAGLAESFHTLPIGGMISKQGYYDIVLWGGSVFAYGLQLSLPLLAALLITNLALGVLTRAAPQLNLFAVGFPITLGLGFFVLMLFIPYLAPILDRLTQEGLMTMLRVAHP